MQSSRRGFCSGPSGLSDSAETLWEGRAPAHGPGLCSRHASSGGTCKILGCPKTPLRPCLLAGFPHFSLKKAVPSFGSDSAPLPSKAGFVTLHLCTLSLRSGSSLGKHTALLSMLSSTYRWAPKTTVPQAEAFLHSPSELTFFLDS